MMPVKENLEKRQSEFCQYIKEFAMKDFYTNDKDYNMGRCKIMNNLRIDLFDPVVKYYCMCNNLELRDVLECK